MSSHLQKQISDPTIKLYLHSSSILNLVKSLIDILVFALFMFVWREKNGLTDASISAEYISFAKIYWIKILISPHPQPISRTLSLNAGGFSLNNPLGQTMIANFCYHETMILIFYFNFLLLDAEDNAFMPRNSL